LHFADQRQHFALEQDAGGDEWPYRKGRYQLVVRQIYILWTNQWLS
jgi:hypothetical protein